MRIGNIIINRASKLRNVLKDKNPKTEVRKKEWNQLYGIYSSRIFGFCIYRTTYTMSKEETLLKDLEA